MKKKFVSLLLAAALVFSLGVPAFAEGAEALPAEPEADGSLNPSALSFNIKCGLLSPYPISLTAFGT